MPVLKKLVPVLSEIINFLKIYTLVIVLENYTNHNFKDTKTVNILITLHKIQKLYNIIKSNNFYFL